MPHRPGPVGSRDTDPTPLSQRLRVGTRAAHESAERSAFLERLLDGRLGLGAWRRLLEQLGYVYLALETTAGMMRENHPCNELLSVELNRADAIAADLRALEARLGEERLGMLPSTGEYVERILDCRHDPVRYLAHHCTRYLGDLSGGQAMRVRLDRAYGLPETEAAFFRFDGIRAIPPFKQRYRDALDRLGLTEADTDRLVEEARESFALNEQLFTELDEVTDALRPAAAA